MISITNKQECCGCSACTQRCPKQCISMQADNEGFMYPIVNATECIDCGLCEKVCPVINPNDSQKPIKVYSVINKNKEILMQSSSGGIFTILAEKTIKKGGVVFGVRFNEEWQVKFSYAETIDEIAPFRGSKYVQAEIGDAYKKAENFLKQGREVLFSGTPCQVAALKKFLRKEYSNLTTIDMFCHGVPSPLVWSIYLQETYTKLIGAKTIKKDTIISAKSGEYKSGIKAISFRSKINGWRKYSFLMKLNFSTNDGENTKIFSQPIHSNTYMKAFLSNLSLRPACYKCPAKQGKGASDITIADFWGIWNIAPDIDYEKGVGAIFLNTEKGIAAFSNNNCQTKEFTYNDVVRYNPALIKSSIPHPKRELFFKKIGENANITTLIEKLTRRNIISRILDKIKITIKI